MHKQLLLVLLFLLNGAITAFAQKTVTGKVADAQGEPLIGVTVSVKGAGQGTITDVNGIFSLRVNPNDVLVFSYTGMKTQEIAVGERATIDLTLEDTGIAIEQVVVTGYTETYKQAFTGSAVSVAPAKIENAPRVSFQESLQGNVAGLFLTQGNGQPGANQQVRIRGVGSINGATEPLYVVDGIPLVAGDISRVNTTSNTIAGLNPNDIESINVLKDASATSLYGSRGANGVIIITTKQGKTGKPKLDVSMQTGVQQITYNDENKPLSTPEFIELLSEGLVNNGTIRFNNQNITTDEQARAYLASRFDPNVNTDWFNEIIRPGRFSDLNLALSGGTDKNRYYLSGGYTDNKAITIGSDFKRYAGKLGINSDVYDWLTINANMSGSLQQLNTVAEGGAFANPIRSLYRLAPYLPVYLPDGGYNLNFNSSFNPVAVANTDTRLTNVILLLGGVNAKIKLPVKGMVFEPRINLNRTQVDEEQFRNPDFGDGRSVGGQGFDFASQVTDWINTNLLRYNFLLGDKHGLDFTLGQEAQSRSRKNISVSASNYVAGLTTLANAAKPETAATFKSRSTLVSYFLNGSYSFNSVVYLNGTIRRDGSSRFGRDNRYGTFWSSGIAVNLHKLAMLENSRVFTNVKLRGSYGESGNQMTDQFDALVDNNFASKGLANSGSDYDGDPGVLIGQFANDNLSWERNAPLSLAAEIGLFNRINLTAEYYHRKTKDLLLRAPVSRTNGVIDLLQNLGSMENKGWEISLNTVNFEKPGNGFKWTTDINFTTLTNKVLSLATGDFVDGAYRRVVGKDINTWHQQDYAGVDPQTGRASWWIDETRTEKTSNYAQAKRIDLGNSTPDFWGGLTNMLSFKGIALSFQINFVWGNIINDTWATFTHSDGNRRDTDTGNMARYIYNNRWRKPGDVTDVPAVIWGNVTNSFQSSSRFLYDGSHARLRDLTLSYNLPNALTRAAGLRSAMLFVRGNNLYVWSKDKRIWQDPQVDFDGALNQELPVAKTFTFGVDVSF